MAALSPSTRLSAALAASWAAVGGGGGLGRTGGGGAAALTDDAYRMPKTSAEIRAKKAGTSSGKDARVSVEASCERDRIAACAFWQAYSLRLRL